MWILIPSSFLAFASDIIYGQVLRIELDLDIIGRGISIAALIISIFSYFSARRQAKIAKESLSLGTFTRCLEIWGSNEIREIRRYVREHFPDYTYNEDNTDGEEINLTVKIGNQVKSVNRRVRRLNDEDRKKFERIAVETDRIGFMLFEIKDLPKEFEKAYIEWLCDVFCAVWNRVAPHVYIERKNRRFVPYLEKLAYLAHLVYLRENPNSTIIVLNQEKMKEAFQKFEDLWN